MGAIIKASNGGSKGGTAGLEGYLFKPRRVFSRQSAGSYLLNTPLGVNNLCECDVDYKPSLL